MRTAAILVLALALAGCGMGRAAYQTSQLADKYGCLAKQVKGKAQCPPDNTATQENAPAQEAAPAQ